MSWRQAATTINAKAAKIAKQDFFAPLAVFALNVVGSVRNGCDLTRMERVQELLRALEIELRVLRFNAEKKPVAARQREPRDVEDRVVRLRQPVQREHAEYGAQRSDEDRALEGHRDERRP